MDQRILRVMRRLEAEDAEERAAVGGPGAVPHEERMYTLHPDSSRLVHILVQAAGCRRLVEVGGSHGYSSLWLAHAARLTGGRLTSLEVSATNVEIARQNLEEAGLSDLVEIVLGDARKTLRAVHGPLDFVLLDSWDDTYVECLGIIVPLLRPGGLLVTDNVTAGEPGTAPLVMALEDHPLMETVNVPIGRDIQVSAKTLDATG
ncbi:MAG: class I SAM-dependent methyltransferase [Dehalococcoidia bacterium]|jgi:predicted O-methyltransferase YrrM|nr:class I SAM-dependent methyltransferase [Dehalococcoidia bacterium]